MTKIYFVEIVCPTLDLINGTLDYSKGELSPGYPIGTRASFSCAAGNKVEGPLWRYCKENGQWTNGPATCICNEMYFLG